ncbi:hypothetical protein [Maritalea myrionectae]|uniref:hypothetical protein n=1 Tax=Maritalea myrionectae TaxID=454601 RepID=UPI0004801086|nr:hypothetical protein [Maritalea myrionectae]
MHVAVQLFAVALITIAGIYGLFASIVGYSSETNVDQKAVLKLFLEICVWLVVATTFIQAVVYIAWISTRPDFHFNNIDRVLAKNYYWNCNSCSAPMSLIPEVFEDNIDFQQAETQVLDAGYKKRLSGPKNISEALAEGLPLVYEKEVPGFGCIRWFQLSVFVDTSEQVSDVTGYFAGRCLL